jgi:hypothetical protein
MVSHVTVSGVWEGREKVSHVTVSGVWVGSEKVSHVTIFRDWRDNGNVVTCNSFCGLEGEGKRCHM